MAKRSLGRAGRVFLVLVISWSATVTRAELRTDDAADLSADQMKNLRGKLDSMTQALVQRRKQQLLAKHHQDAAVKQNVENLVHPGQEKQLPVAEERRAVEADFTHSKQAAPAADAPVEAAAVATQSLKKEAEARKPVLVAPEYNNGAPTAPLGSSSPRFASSKAAQKSKQGAMDAKNPWWLNPPPWWLPPPPEWGSPPPSIYSGFYNPYSQPQSFHRVPPSQPAYHPYPLPY